MSGLAPPNRGAVPKGPSKLMRPTKEQNTVADILQKNKGALEKNKKKSKKGKPPPKGKKGAKTRKGGKGKGAKGTKGKGGPRKKSTRRDAKGKRGKKGKKAQAEEVKKHNESEEKEDVDPYLLLKQEDSNVLIKMFLHKLVNYPLVSDHLGQFGNQLQSSMINFAKDMILPQLMSTEHVDRFSSIINDRKLIYLLRQSFIRWLMVHRGQMKLVFKRKGDENAKNALKYDVVITRNHIIQKLASTLHHEAAENADIKDIISKLPTKTKLAYLHFLRSDIKNPFLAQLQTPIPNKLLPNTKCRVPSISGKMPDKEEEKQPHQVKEEAVVMAEEHEMHNHVSKRLHSVFEGYKDCVLLSEKQVLVDILKTQYKLIQNAIDDYGRIRWMDAPIDHGHIGLMQRELIRDHQQIIHKCNAIEADFRKKLQENITEVNKMRLELKKRKDVYLDLVEKKCFKFLKCKLSAIHEEIERKKQAIALHEKKRENYLNHAKESLKNEQNMRKGVDLVEQTYHKYLRQLTKAKVEYAVIDEKLDSDSFYMLQEKLNALRNKNDRYWYWYKKEKEIYSKSIKAFSRMNRFFKKIEEFLQREYGEESQELTMFREEYYKHVLDPNVEREQLNNKYNREIFEKKKISDIEIVYAMKKKDIKLPPHHESVMNRLYTRMKPKDLDLEMGGGSASHPHERRTTNDAMFLNNEIKKHKDRYGDTVDDSPTKKQKEDEEQQRNKEQHVNDSESEPSEEPYDDEDQSHYIKTSDHDIFGSIGDEEDDEDDLDDFDDDFDDDEDEEESEESDSAPEMSHIGKSRFSREDELLPPDDDTEEDEEGKNEEQHLLYEDSKQYHQDYEEQEDHDPNRPSSTIFNDPNRPSSTIFKAELEEEEEEEQTFFAEPQFFNDNMNNIKEDEEEEVLEVSGFAKINTTNIVDDNMDGNDDMDEDEDEEEYSFEDDEDEDDMDDDEDDEDSYEDSSEYVRLMATLEEEDDL